MIMDEFNEFADGDTGVQIAAGSALIGDVIDLGAGGTGFLGKQMFLVVQVDTEIDSAGDGASVQIQLVSDAAAAIATDGSASVHVDLGTIAEADLTEGKTFVIPVPPRGGVNEFERYLGIVATVSGETVTAGAVSAFLTMDPTLWKSYADGNN